MPIHSLLQWPDISPMRKTRRISKARHGEVLLPRSCLFNEVCLRIGLNRMKIPLDYNCHFCGKPGVAYYDDSCPPLRLEIWQKMLACNRCADYKTKLAQLIDGISATVRTFATWSHSKQAEARAEAAKTAQDRLTIQTRELASLVCNFHHLETVWEMPFVELLMQRPDRAFGTISDYERRIAILARESVGLGI